MQVLSSVATGTDSLGSLGLPPRPGFTERNVPGGKCSSRVLIFRGRVSRRLRPVRAVSEKDRAVEHLARLASDAASSLRQVTDQALKSIPPEQKERLQQQTEQTAAELRARAERLRVEALNASSRLTGIFGQTEEERAVLLRRGNDALFSAASLLRTQSLAATSRVSTLLQEAEQNKEKLLEIARGAPEPIRDIAETAVTAHSTEATKKGAVIHDFCLGITYGGIMVAGGLLWFLVTGSVNAIRFGVLLGGILLAAAVGSLKAWKAGNSSNPYIAAQGVAAYIIFAREAFRYYQTKAFFPTAIVAMMSLAMVAFYAYVVLAGGNPPPRVKRVSV